MPVTETNVLGSVVTQVLMVESVNTAKEHAKADKYGYEIR